MQFDEDDDSITPLRVKISDGDQIGRELRRIFGKAKNGPDSNSSGMHHFEIILYIYINLS